MRGETLDELLLLVMLLLRFEQLRLEAPQLLRMPSESLSLSIECIESLSLSESGRSTRGTLETCPCLEGGQTEGGQTCLEELGALSDGVSQRVAEGGLFSRGSFEGGAFPSLGRALVGGELRVEGIRYQFNLAETALHLNEPPHMCALLSSAHLITWVIMNYIHHITWVDGVVVPTCIGRSARLLRLRRRRACRMRSPRDGDRRLSVFRVGDC